MPLTFQGQQIKVVYQKIEKNESTCFRLPQTKMFWISAKNAKKNYVSNKNKIAEIKRNFFILTYIDSERCIFFFII